VDLNPRRDYAAGALDSVTTGDELGDDEPERGEVALQSQHSADIEREEREAAAGQGAPRGLVARWLGALFRRF
jgi:hypothetical protein